MSLPPFLRRTARRACRLVPLALLGVLPGCLTGMLWRDELVPPGVPDYEVEFVGLDVRQTEGELQLTMPASGAGPQLRYSGAMGPAAADANFVPDRADAADVAVATRLLRGAGACEVVQAQLAVRRDRYIGEGVAEVVELELTVRPRLERFASIATADELPAAVRPTLLATSGPRYAFPSAPTGEPGLDVLCRQRLATLDLAGLFDANAPVTLDRVAFTDAAGRLTTPRRIRASASGRAQVIPVGEPEHHDDEQLQRDLGVLGACTMWAEVLVSGQRRFLRLSAAEVWLAGSGQSRAGVMSHRSHWRRGPAPAADESSQLVAAMPCALLQRDTSLLGNVIANDGLSVLEKVLLTPFTAVLDVISPEFWRFFLPPQPPSATGRSRRN